MESVYCLKKNLYLGRKSAQGETHRRTMQVLTNSDDEDDGLVNNCFLIPY